MENAELPERSSIFFVPGLLEQLCDHLGKDAVRYSLIVNKVPHETMLKVCRDFDLFEERFRQNFMTYVGDHLPHPDKMIFVPHDQRLSSWMGDLSTWSLQLQESSAV